VQGFMEAACEKGLLEGFALGCGLACGDGWAEDAGVAQAGKPGEGGGFDVGFGYGCGHCYPLNGALSLGCCGSYGQKLIGFSGFGVQRPFLSFKLTPNFAFLQSESKY